jgi:hypothetical protein
VVLESSRTVIVVIASVKDDERGDKGHFWKPIESVCYVKPRSEHPLFLHECFSDFTFCFVCDGWQNRATYLHHVLREAW